MKAPKTPNYSDTQVAAIIAAAPVTKDVAARLAVELGKTARSVIAKAVRLEVYQSQGPVTKSGEPVTKKETLVAEIGEVVTGNLEGLEKAPKAALLAIAAFTARFASEG